MGIHLIRPHHGFFIAMGGKKQTQVFTVVLPTTYSHPVVLWFFLRTIEKGFYGFARRSRSLNHRKVKLIPIHHRYYEIQSNIKTA